MVENISNLQEGTNHFKDYIIFKNKEHFRIYDRICDHNGGKLITKPDKKIICPLHGWQFDPKSGRYLNNKCEKKQLKFIIEKNLLKISLNRKVPKFKSYKNDKSTKITFLNHACLLVETDELKFATDPWILGPAFCRGWWLLKNSPLNSFEKLNDCNFIYISHNHPDHLHPLTLEKIDKNKTILTPKFKSNSTANYLSSLGFKNIITLDFGYEYYCDKLNFNLAVLKSGDFRDDSGIYFSNGNFEAIFSVDSNFLNFLELPKNITLLASSFAGGASGYPLCFTKFSSKTKSSIVKRNINSIKITNQKMLVTTKARYFLPYAGFFTEAAKRDLIIKKNNIKNKIKAYEDMCRKNNTMLLNVDSKQEYSFSGNKLKKSLELSKNKILLDKKLEKYIDEAKMKYSNIKKNRIEKYFLKSQYKDNIILKIILTDDSFKKFFLGFTINFSSNKPVTNFFEKKYEPSLQKLHKKNFGNIIELKVRKEAFLEVIDDKLPWEDLLIGFQTRINRLPDVYNANFWYFFTNVYVKKYAKRRIEDCSGCAVIEQKLDKEIQHDQL
tara:strand:+ start:9418 stop:11079 length:1662 start_codon:yes stop_codon:yes gene_type:complete